MCMEVLVFHLPFKGFGRRRSKVHALRGAWAEHFQLALVDIDAETGAGHGFPAAGPTEAERARGDIVCEQELAEAAFGEGDVGDELKEPATGGGEDAGF